MRKVFANIRIIFNTCFKGQGKAIVTFLLTVSVPCIGIAGNQFRNYVLTAEGYDCEIILVNNDILNPSEEYTTVFDAYDRGGMLLASVDRTGEIPNGKELRIGLTQLFPSIQDIGAVGLVEITSSNRKDVWVIYKNGNQRAMVPVAGDGNNPVYNLHFTNNSAYWNFLNNLAHIDDDASHSVTATVYPGLEKFIFDGTANAYGYQMPNLNPNRSSTSLNMKNLFGGTIPDNAAWMQMTGEAVQKKGTEAALDSENCLVSNTLFMKANGESGGAFDNPPAFEELIVPHIAADGVYWWTGLVLNNPHNEPVDFIIQYYRSDGAHLDTDPATSSIDDYSAQLPSFGKIVDLIENFGMPDGAGFARILAEKPIIGGELFGGEPSGANWPIMAGVKVLLPGTGGYLNSVSGISPPPESRIIPIVDSKAASENEAGTWTGLAFVNPGSRNQEIVLAYQAISGMVLETQVYTVASMNKQVETMDSLLKIAGLENIRDSVKQLTIYGAPPGSPPSDNREVMVYALHGGLEKTGGQTIHNWMLGEDAANTSPIRIHLFIANETRGIVRDAQPLSGSMNTETEDNDTLLSHLIINMRDSVNGHINSFNLLTFDENWTQAGTLGEFTETAHPELSANPYSVDFTFRTPVTEEALPYGTYKLGIEIQTTRNGVAQIWQYRIPDKTITRHQESSLTIQNAYSILSNKTVRGKLAEILGRENVTIGETHAAINAAETNTLLASLTNGDLTADDEMRLLNGSILAKIANTLLFNIRNATGGESTTCFHLPDEETEREIQLFWEEHGGVLSQPEQRNDGARKIEIHVEGSIQNPAWSPDGKSILCTRFRTRYNEAPSDLLIFNMESNCLKTLVSDGNGNVNLPGSAWNPITHKIVFSSSRDPHDEIFIIDEGGETGSETRITNRDSKVAYEPSFSPDGQWVVFESHREDVEGNGIITKYKLDGTGTYQTLTGETEDCRQPNWSPAGNLILYQKITGGQWDIWVMNTDGSIPRMATAGAGDKTDASFSPDGQWIVYSSDNGELDLANLYMIPVSGGSPIRLTTYTGYDGAPSWSPNGGEIAFESCAGDPDTSSGTTIWEIKVPEH